MTGRPIVLAAGGTGGHMVPAHVLADELARRGRRVVLFSDARGLRLPGLFESIEKHRLASGSPSRSGPLGTGFSILSGVGRALALLARLRPAVVVGFGGYPSLPALIAALALRLPAFIHEQNAVLGRVNRRLAARVRGIATSYAKVRFLPEALSARVRLTGNPVRPEIAAIPPAAPGETLNLLVLGGSQGASILSEAVPPAVVRLAVDGRPIRVVQQCREADIMGVRETYRQAGVSADLAPFFTDVPARLAWADLVIARAGASTIAELTCAGRASILVPLPSAMDDHQTANAAALVEGGAAELVPQSEFTPDRLLAALRAFTPQRLGQMAVAARAQARPCAASDLADFILETL